MEKYHSFIFYVLEKGNPHALILDCRGGKDVIRVIIFSSKKKKKKIVITFKKAITVGYLLLVFQWILLIISKLFNARDS